jgi:hypothetical protein
MEIWKDIPWLEWKYQASSLWRVKSLPRNDWAKRITKEKIIKDIDNWNWYRYVTISISSKRKNYYVHKLIAETFLWESNWRYVNHKDLNKTNNNLDNLEWVTRSENMLHYFNNTLWDDITRNINLERWLYRVQIQREKIKIWDKKFKKLKEAIEYKKYILNLYQIWEI